MCLSIHKNTNRQNKWTLSTISLTIVNKNKFLIQNLPKCTERLLLLTICTFLADYYISFDF